MSNNLLLVAEERAECHQKIFEKVTETDSLAMRILKEPNPERKLHPAGKVIIAVKTTEQAEELKQFCLNQIQQSNFRIEQLLNKNLPRYTIKYKINTVKAAGNVFLSVRSAESRKIVSGTAIINILQSFLEQLDEKDKAAAEIIQKDLQKFQREKKYTFAKSTGNNYKITYYNSDSSKREQISVGNILIIISDTDTKIQDAPERKRRTDRKEPLFVLRLPLFGIISVYPVINNY